MGRRPENEGAPCRRAVRAVVAAENRIIVRGLRTPAVTVR
jgi:hypothetical protein